MPNVTELFAPPDELRPVLQRPFEDWSEADYDRVFRWLHDEPRRAYLQDLAVRAAFAHDIPPDDIYKLVEEFYSRPLRRLLRRAQHKNFGALLLVEFEKFLLRASYAQGGGAVEQAARPDPENQGITEGPRPKRKRLSPVHRLMALWRPSPPVPAGTPAPAGEGDWVETSVFGPRRVAQERHFMIQAFTHTQEQSDEARRFASEFDDEAARLGVQSLAVKVLPGTRLTYTLRLPGLSIVEPNQEMHWHRKTENVAWGVEVPADHRVGSIIGTVTVTADGMPIGRITIKVDILPAGKGKTAKMDALDPVATGAEKFRQAFISYASQDRNIVVRLVQMLRINEIEFFQDLLHLEPGDRWARELYRRIEKSDLFLLFWSSHAKASEWVMNEVRYALSCQKGDVDALPVIHPVIVEGPPPVPPPPELKHLHFNDPLIYLRDRAASV